MDEPNLKTYEAIKMGYAQTFATATLGTVIIPAVGPTPMHTFNILLNIGVKSNRINTILRRMTTASIKQSLAFRPTLRKPGRTPTE